MPSVCTRKRPRRLGAAAVEFALCVPIFFTFVFAAIDMGRAFMVGSLLSNAARTGCRTGILPTATSSGVQTAVTNALKGQGITGSTTTVTLNGNAKDVSTAQTGDIVSVTVSVPYSNVTWLPMSKFVTGTIVGQFSLPHE